MLSMMRECAPLEASHEQLQVKSYQRRASVRREWQRRLNMDTHLSAGVDFNRRSSTARLAGWRIRNVAILRV